MGKVPSKRGEQVSTCGGYVGFSPIVLGHSCYSSCTSYTPPPCNHPSRHGIAPSLRCLYPWRSLPLPRCCPCGHGLLLSWRHFIAITSSTLFPLCSPLFCNTSSWDHYHHHILGWLLFASGGGGVGACHLIIVAILFLFSCNWSSLSIIIITISPSVHLHCLLIVVSIGWRDHLLSCCLPLPSSSSLSHALFDRNVVAFCHRCHCRPSSIVVLPSLLLPLASYKGWLLLFRQGWIALALVVLPVCGALSSLWSLCPCTIIIVNCNQMVETPHNDGPQPPTSPPLPSLMADCCILVIVAFGWTSRGTTMMRRSCQGGQGGQLIVALSASFSSTDPPTILPSSHNHLVPERLCWRALGRVCWAYFASRAGLAAHFWLIVKFIVALWSMSIFPLKIHSRRNSKANSGDITALALMCITLWHCPNWQYLCKRNCNRCGRGWAGAMHWNGVWWKWCCGQSMVHPFDFLSPWKKMAGNLPTGPPSTVAHKILSI